MERDNSGAPEGIDIRTPSPARMYDYYLGGKDNLTVDRDAAEQVLKLWPETEGMARANRRFLVRAVQYLAGQGVDQFLDIGTGVPTSPNVHEIAREVNPAARVAYVDNDPVVAAHNRALRDTDGVISVQADLRDPETLLGDPRLRELIDFDRPVALLFIAVLHFIGDEAAGMVARYRRELVPGSYVALSVLTVDGIDPTVRRRAQSVYAKSTAPLVMRTRADVEPFFDGCELVEPGLVPVNEWHADEPPFTAGGLVGVGRVTG